MEIAVDTPVNQTSRQRDLLREFKAMSKDNYPESQDLVSRVRGFWEGMKG